MTTDRITALFFRYMDGTATEAERYELSCLALMEHHASVIRRLEEEYWDKMDKGEDSLTGEEIKNLMLKVQKQRKASVRVLSWRRIAVAASVVLAIGTASYFIFNRQEGKKEELVRAESKDVEAPKLSKAIITLADGRRVSIDSLTSLTQNNVNLIRTAGGKIIYSGNTDEVIYNTLTNPRGSRVVDMQLSDGSYVWLNAGSSVTYPVAFAGNERRVSITGEAYFEVAHDAAKPFFVTKGSTQVQVLGTHFNVNAYDDETDIKVTLLEGSVKVSNGNSEGLLKPAQQALVAAGNGTSASLRVTGNINVEEVMAWKNGLFNFEGADLKTAMRQLERWYDITVVYERGVPVIRFGGEMSRDVNLAEVLEMLQDAGVHFRMDAGRRLVVMP